MKLASKMMNLVPTAFLWVAMASTVAAYDGSNACVKTSDGTGKFCHTLTGETEDVATVCVEMLDEELRVSFEAVGDWVMVTNKFWFDEEVNTAPRLSDGSLDMEGFPYYICNSTGFSEWTLDAPFDFEDCHGSSSLDVSMIAYAEVEKADANGKLQRSTSQKVFAYEHSVGYGSTFIGWLTSLLTVSAGRKNPQAPACVPKLPNST